MSRRLGLLVAAAMVATGGLRSPVAAQSRGTERTAASKVRLVVGLVEVYVLDDPAIPIVLRWRLGDSSKRMIRISYPSESASSRIEEKLSTTGRAEVYGIYFDVAKSSIRPESERLVKEIAEVMSKNPGWTLSVEGHTDQRHARRPRAQPARGARAARKWAMSIQTVRPGGRA